MWFSKWLWNIYLDCANGNVKTVQFIKICIELLRTVYTYKQYCMNTDCVQNYTTNQSNKWKEKKKGKKGLTLVYPHHRADIFSNWNCFLYAWLLKQNKKGYLPFDIPFGFDPWSVQLYLECVGGKLTLLGRFGDSLEPIKNWQKEKKRLTGHACIH